MISPEFTQILRSGREHFNGRFGAARRLQPNLHGEGFSAFLAQAVDPVVVAVARIQPERAAEIATIAYDLGLDLAVQRPGGPSERDRLVADGWRRLLPGVAKLVAAFPTRMMGALTNAAYAIASSSSARPDQWLGLMERLGPECDDVDTWLKLGQVAAWRAGLAHYRAAALGIADALPETLALETVGAPPGINWATVRRRLQASPWFDPARLDDDGSRLRVAAQVGAFRGFGGLFREPPLVVASGGHFVVLSGEDAWLLTADAFGATFHRATAEERPRTPPTANLPGRMEWRGVRMVFDGREIDLPDLGTPTSVATNAHTLAITSPLSHRVTLLARATA